MKAKDKSFSNRQTKDQSYALVDAVCVEPDSTASSKTSLAGKNAGFGLTQSFGSFELSGG